MRSAVDIGPWSSAGAAVVTHRWPAIIPPGRAARNNNEKRGTPHHAGPQTVRAVIGTGVGGTYGAGRITW